MRSRTLNLVLTLPTVLLLASGAGCGQSTYKKKATTQGSGSGSFSTDDSLGSGTTSGTKPVASVKINSVGYSSVNVTVRTRSVLKVRFRAEKQNQTSSDGVFYPYSAIGVYVGVGSFSQPTELLSNGYGGYSQQQQSSVIDLSDGISSSCDPSDTSCYTEVTITVNKPNNNDQCLNSGTGYGCPYSHVPEGHGWSGTLLIQTDDTVAL